MSAGGLSSAQLGALENDGGSVAMRWLDMVIDRETQGTGEEKYTLKVIEEPANNYVRCIKSPFNLISVMGPARSGKSTLMNLLAGCKTTELFATYPGMETLTKGIFIPTRSLTLQEFSNLEGSATVEPTHPNTRVSFSDTEGQGAVGDTYDMDLFSPSLVTSRAIIYNRTGGLLTDEILSQLGMMTEAGRRLRAAESSNHDTNAENDEKSSEETSTRPLFGHLFIVFNQFRLNANDTAEALKNLLLNEEKSTNLAATNRNNIRKMLKSCFESIQVFLLPDKLKQEARDGLSNGTKPFILLDDFEPTYLQYFELLRAGLSKALTTPRELSPDVALSGASIADFMPLFADAINKSEPLNVPSIFELAQHAAADKAVDTFIKGLATDVDGLLAEDAKPTLMLQSLIEKDIGLLLFHLTTTISYMPSGIIEKARNDALAAARPLRASLMASNLSRLKAIMSQALTDTVTSMSTQISEQFTGEGLLISLADLENGLAAISTRALSNYETKGLQLDPDAFPSDWKKIFQDALDVTKRTFVAYIDDEWRVWVSTKSQAGLKKLAEELVGLSVNTQIGDIQTYRSGSAAVVFGAQVEFEMLLEGSYKGAKKAEQTASFKTAAQDAANIQEALWEKNDQEIQLQAKKLVEHLCRKYEIQLQDSLPPHMEPRPYDVIIDPTPFMNQLLLFIKNHRLAETLAAELIFDLECSISSEKSKFSPVYSKACSDYATWLNEHLLLDMDCLISACNHNIDIIPLTTSVSQAIIQTNCDNYGNIATSAFESLLATYGILPNGPTSGSIVASFRQQLKAELTAAKETKLGKYADIVSAYNRALLTHFTKPLIDNTLDAVYPTKDVLRREVDKAHSEFNTRSAGDGTNARQHWDTWVVCQKELEATIDRNNGYKIPDLEGKHAATEEIQRNVITKVWRQCADMANRLNMSYVAPHLFDGNEVENRGNGTLDTSHPEKSIDDTRTFRMTNNFKSTNKKDPWPDHATNLEFFDWSVECYNIIWGNPIVTELKPMGIYSNVFTAGSGPLTIKVGGTSTKSSTIANTKSWGVSSSVEFTSKIGFKISGKIGDIGAEENVEHTVKAAFNGKFESSKSESLTTLYAHNSEISMTVAANKSVAVNQMTFETRTTLPYTAIVRVVPRLRFQNGFTIWGGGGSYSQNPNTGALKDKFKEGDRTLRDFEFNRLDEILSDARGNYDPWEWKLAMGREPRLVEDITSLADVSYYTVNVRGKWEGVTGEYTVTQVTPASTPISFMPDGI